MNYKEKERAFKMLEEIKKNDPVFIAEMYKKEDEKMCEFLKNFHKEHKNEDINDLSKRFWQELVDNFTSGVEKELLEIKLLRDSNDNEDMFDLQQNITMIEFICNSRNTFICEIRKAREKLKEIEEERKENEI